MVKLKPNEAEDGPTGPLRLGGVLDRLEGVSLRAGGPIRRAAGSGRLNPLPHAGTISLFLLAVVIVTGFYITLFFEYGFEASYRSVTKMDDHPIQSVARAVHRYSSAALVVTLMVHAWRIFVAKRFTGLQRIWRWATGMGSLFLVWFAGVTGYWLIWDTRADALNEIMIGLFGGTGPGRSFAVDSVIGSDTGSGWTVVLAVWFIHLGLTAVIAYLTYRHLRRSRLAWLPPRHWMALMTAALVLASLVFPIGMLDPAARTSLPGSMPLDPFVLFLLPPLLSPMRWLVILAGAGFGLVLLLLPRLLTRRTPPVVDIDAEACTGCDLCVVDCPYLALELVDRDDAERPLAVVDPDRCVGCGICIGSCSFGAMDLPGYPSIDAINPESRPVVLACARHMTHSSVGPNDNTLFVTVSCTGMLHHSVVGTLTEKGATSVQIVGCGPNDCTYGIGNTLTAERFEGDRAPHISRKWAGQASEDFVAPTTMDQVVAAPGEHPIADPKSYPSDGSALSRAGLLVIVSIAVVALATRAPFTGASDEAAVRLVVNHEAGRTIVGADVATGQPGDAVTAEVSIDGETTMFEISRSDNRSIGIVDRDLSPGPHQIEVILVEGTDRTVVYREDVTVDGGQRVYIEVSDTPLAPGVDEGRAVFNSRSGGACDVCHSVRPGEVKVGPSLAGIGTRGNERIPGLDASGYIRQSILAPDAYIVEGFPSGQMLDIYQDRLSETDLEALVAYLTSLTEEDQ